MSENDKPGGVEPAPYVEHIRLLSSDFEIRTNSRELAGHLPRVTPRAEHVMPAAQRHSVTITWTGDEFRISGDCIEDDFELSVSSALENLLQALHRYAIAALPDHIAIRAASGIHRECSFLIVGAPRSGKSALALRLLLEGFEMTGDGLALLHKGSAMAFPRKFLLREDSLALMPRLALFDKFGSLGNARAGRLVALDPTDFGKPWRIVSAPVSTVFYIEPNHGAQTTLLRCGKVEMTRRVLQQCALLNSGRRNWLGELSGTVDRADTFVIELGDPESALAEIKGVFS